MRIMAVHFDIYKFYILYWILSFKHTSHAGVFVIFVNIAEGKQRAAVTL